MNRARRGIATNEAQVRVIQMRSQVIAQIIVPNFYVQLRHSKARVILLSKACELESLGIYDMFLLSVLRVVGRRFIFHVVLMLRSQS